LLAYISSHQQLKPVLLIAAPIWPKELNDTAIMFAKAIAPRAVVTGNNRLYTGDILPSNHLTMIQHGLRFETLEIVPDKDSTRVLRELQLTKNSVEKVVVEIYPVPSSVNVQQELEAAFLLAPRCVESVTVEDFGSLRDITRRWKPLEVFNTVDSEINPIFIRSLRAVNGLSSNADGCSWDTWIQQAYIDEMSIMFYDYTLINLSVLLAVVFISKIATRLPLFSLVSACSAFWAFSTGYPTYTGGLKMTLTDVLRYQWYM
jgi:hypothetical protein